MALPIDEKEKQPSPVPQKKNTGFVNLSKILGANQGSKLGSAVSGSVQGTTGQAKSALGSAQGQFAQQSQAGRLGTEQDVGKLKQTLQNPINASDADVKEFERFRTTGYTGPQGLQTADQLGQQAQRAQQVAGAVGSQAGRMGLLQQTVGKGNYSSGKSKLDELILGRQAGDQLRQARRDASITASQIGRGITGAQDLARQYGQESEAFKQQVSKELGAAEQPTLQELTQRIATAQAEKEQLGKSLFEGLAKGELTQEQADLLGLQQGQDIYGTDLSRFLQAGLTPATQQTVASAEQLARMNALARLGGKQAFGTQDQAGSFFKNQYGINQEDLTKAVQGAKSEYESRIQPLQASKSAYETAGNVLNSYDNMRKVQSQMQNEISQLPPLPNPEFTDPDTFNQMATQRQAEIQAIEQKYAPQMQVQNPREGLWGIINSLGRPERLIQAMEAGEGSGNMENVARAIQAYTQGQNQEYQNIQDIYKPQQKLKIINPFQQTLGQIRGSGANY